MRKILYVIQLKVMAAIETCRTAALGGHVERCLDCGGERVAYYSCRNRHCPKCHGAAGSASTPTGSPRAGRCTGWHLQTEPKLATSVGWRDADTCRVPAGSLRGLTEDERALVALAMP